MIRGATSALAGAFAVAWFTASGAATFAAGGAGTAAAPSPGPAAVAHAKPPIAKSEALATFAGGCFWCMVSEFADEPGVSRVVSGYTGGKKVNPTYEDVSSGETGHAEAVEVHYDPARVNYPRLLEIFWSNVDPTDSGGQFVDRGTQYRTAIFFHSPEQKKDAEESRRKLETSHRFGDKKIVTEITPAGAFYAAEDYHQDYYQKNPDHYRRYRQGSGRDQFLEKTWGKSGAKH